MAPGVNARALRRLRRLLKPALWSAVTPLSDNYGFDRGLPIDRYYIEAFLREHKHDIRGRVIEVKDAGYTNRFGTAVARRDVLDIDATNPAATIVADIAAASNIPSGSSDCMILTQVLQYVYDARTAVRECFRVLSAGGVLLATVPAIARNDANVPDADYWRYTTAGCRRLFGDVFGPANIMVHSRGNLASAIAALRGAAAEEMSADHLDVPDDRYPVLITVRASKTP